MINHNPLRILVVDDTIFYRKIVSDILSELPDVKVVGTASNGKIAMSRVTSLNPDLLILDIEMPEMNVVEVPDEDCQYGQKGFATMCGFCGGDELAGE